MWNSLFADNCQKLNVFALCAKHPKVRNAVFCLYECVKASVFELSYVIGTETDKH